MVPEFVRESEPGPTRRLLVTWAGLITTVQPEANQPRSNSANVPLMNVSHLIKAHPRGVLLAELCFFSIRPRCSQAGGPRGEPTVGERRSFMDALTGRHLVHALLDHLNALGEPVFDYLIFDPEKGFSAVMPKPLALEFVAVVGRSARGVRVWTFDRLGEPNTNPDARTCHKPKDNPCPPAVSGKKRSRSSCRSWTSAWPAVPLRPSPTWRMSWHT